MTGLRAMGSLLLLLATAFLACSSAPRAASTATAPSSSSAAASPSVDKADVAAWERAIAILDTGDLNAAYDAVHSLDAGPGRASLLAAIDEMGRGVRSPALANAPITRVQSLVAPPPSSSGGVRAVSARRVPLPKGSNPPSASAADHVYAMSDWSFPGALDSEREKPALAFPRRLGERSLHRARASDGRWLGIYAGGREVAVIDEHGELVALLDFSAWKKLPIAWGELSGDTLFVSTQGHGDRVIAAVTVSTGAVLWRSESAAFVETFALGADRIIAWSYPRVDAKAGEIVAIDRTTGRTLGRRATPEIRLPANVDVAISPGARGDGVVGVHWGGSEHLAVAIKLPPEPKKMGATPPPPGSATRIPKSTIADAAHARARLDAWFLLDRKNDPRAAIRALRPLLESDPSSFVAGALFEGAIDALRKARREAGAALATITPTLVPDDAPSGVAPVRRPSKRSLAILATRPTGSFAAFEEELERATTAQMAVEDGYVPPSWVPDFVGERRRDPEASSVSGSYRVEVYKAYHSRSLTIVWSGREGKIVSLLDVDREVRFASAQDGVVFLTVRDANGQGFNLEARDAKTGKLYWRAPDVHDQYSAFEKGYIVASTSDRNRSQVGSGHPEIVLVEADTGAVTSRLGGATEPQGAFLVFRTGATLRAVNERQAFDLSVE